MRRLNQTSNLSPIFDCFSGKFGTRFVFNLELWNLTDSDVALHLQLILELNSAHVKFDVWIRRFSEKLNCFDNIPRTLFAFIPVNFTSHPVSLLSRYSNS